MKLVAFLAWINALLAVMAVLLGAAPFAPAIFVFVLCAPLAALFAAKNQTMAALVVVGAALSAWLASPIELTAQQTLVPVAWLIWVGLSAVLVIFFSRHRIFRAVDSTHARRL